MIALLYWHEFVSKNSPQLLQAVRGSEDAARNLTCGVNAETEALPSAFIAAAIP